MTKLGITNRERWLVTVFSLGILIALAIAYQPVMFNFFCSDDFYIVAWLSHCKQNPLLLFQAVYEGTPYYRPVLNFLLFLEHLLCGTNSVLFRLISIGYLLVTAVIFWFILCELGNMGEMDKGQNESRRPLTNWCFFSAGFFLLYPLHTEPINWFVCTTELLTGLFIMISFLFYILWQKKQKFLFALISFFVAACAFLTKEIAVILPAILFLYEFLVASNIQESRSDLSRLKSFAHNLFSAFKRSLIYWIMLIAYLCLRKIMTGNFLGNWSNAVFHFSDNSVMYKAWLQSLQAIIFPLSSAVFSSRSIIYYFWIILIVSLVISTVVCVLTNPRRIRLLMFLVGWFLLCLVPMAKLLWITPDLLDARYGYIASIPLCAFLMFGLAFGKEEKLRSKTRYTIFLCILSFSCFILHINNEAWAEAGKLTSGLLGEFKRLHSIVPDSERIYLLNIPVKYNGVAIAGLKSLESMNDKPFLDRTYSNCVWLLNDDQNLPIGLLHDSIEQGKIKSHFFSLDAADRKFHAVKMYKQSMFDTKNTDVVKNVVCQSINGSSKVKVHSIENLGRAKIVSKRRTIYTWSAKKIPCWSTDAFVFKVNVSRKLVSKSTEVVQVAFTNDISANTNETNQVSFPLQLKEGEQWLVVPLRGKPGWSFGGYCRDVSIAFPLTAYANIEEAHAASFSEFLPRMNLDNSHYNPQVGQIELKTSIPAIIDYSVLPLNECTGVALEVIAPGEYFSDLNSPKSDTRSVIEYFSKGSTGQIKLTRNQLPVAGFYKLRLRPLNENREQCGFCSDHVIMHAAN